MERPCLFITCSSHDICGAIGRREGCKAVKNGSKDAPNDREMDHKYNAATIKRRSHDNSHTLV